MNFRIFRAALLCRFAVIVSCAPPRSATELFDLRSKCAALGDKVLEDNIIGPAVRQTQLSHYSPATNRCFVKLDVMTADLRAPSKEFIRHEYLFDGQTRELLAAASTEGENRSGNIFADGLKRFARDPILPTFEEAQAVIEKMTAEER